MKPVHHPILTTVAAMLAAAVLAPAASATITPTVTLTQTGTRGGATTNVSLDLSFAPSGTDSPKDLTVALPPGLLANAAIDGGACLNATAAVAACQVGIGAVTAKPIIVVPPLPPTLGPAISIPIRLYLVAPPSPADLAGVLTVANPGTPLAMNLGSPAEVTVRPSGDPAGVGLTQHFANLPATFSIAGVSTPVSVTRLQSMLTGLRLPATCPSPAANVTVQADSYADPTSRAASAPLKVTACSGLPFAPRFSVSATRDIADSGVQVVTDIAQNANEAPSRSVRLTLPPSVLAPNAAAVISNRLLCTDPTFVTCKPIGSASSASPLYPKPLIGRDYLTGSLSAPAITIRFPLPFALTLGGPVTLATGTTTFSNLPDIPVTDLKVTLAGGPAAAFAATCNPAVGTATSSLTTQNGDRTVGVSAPFAVANCPPGSGGSGGSGVLRGLGGPKGGTRPAGAHGAGRPSLSRGLITGLGRRRPRLSFTATAGRNAAKLSTISIALPRGLTVIRHRHRHRRTIAGVRLRGARAASVTLVGGRLVIRLRRPADRFMVILTPLTLRESAGLRRLARHHRVHRLRVGVQLRDSSQQLTRLQLSVRRIRL